MTYSPDSPEVTALYNAVFDAERYEGISPKQCIADLLNEAYERGRLQGIVKYESPGKAINRKLEQNMKGTP